MKHKRVQVALNIINIRCEANKNVLHCRYLLYVPHTCVGTKECILYLAVMYVHAHVVHIVDIKCLQRTLYGVTCTPWLVLPLFSCSRFDKPSHNHEIIISTVTASRDVETTFLSLTMVPSTCWRETFFAWHQFLSIGFSSQWYYLGKYKKICPLLWTNSSRIVCWLQKSVNSLNFLHHFLSIHALDIKPTLL